MVQACGHVRQNSIPVAWVTRQLSLPERTVRRWRQGSRNPAPARCGRPARPATRAQRNAATQFLRERGADAPLYALRRAFPDMRRADLQDVHRRFRRAKRRRQRRWQSRLDWRGSGTVWAADFKERREPLEGRYGWILSVKDLASRCQLAWLPLEAATAAAVQTVYQQLFDEHGPPLVLKSDNGAQFRDAGTKLLLAAHQVTALYNPPRRPSYNGGVERANGQLAGYQEALAQWRGRPGLPTCDDAESARRLANELTRPEGLRGPTAEESWAARPPITPTARAAFLATVNSCRVGARAQWNMSPDEPLPHASQAAVDRRAVRDALLAHDLLRILPRHPRRAAKQSSVGTRAEGAVAACAPQAPNDAPTLLASSARSEQLGNQPASRAEEILVTAYYRFKARVESCYQTLLRRWSAK